MDQIATIPIEARLAVLFAIGAALGGLVNWAIYGLAEVFPTREDHHPYNNRTWYGASKIMLEGLLRSFNDIAHLTHPTGPAG